MTEIILVCWVRYYLLLYKHFHLVLSFFSNVWAILLRDNNVWSNGAPTCFINVVDLLAKLWQVISRLGLHLIYWGEPNRMDSVLPRWRESLLSINHWLKHFKSSIKSCSIYCLFLSDTKIPESSAYKSCLFFTTADMSLT